MIKRTLSMTIVLLQVYYFTSDREVFTHTFITLEAPNNSFLNAGFRRAAIYISQQARNFTLINALHCPSLP